MKRFRIEVVALMVLLLPCLVSSRRTPRGFRPSGRKPARYRSLQKKMGDDPTLEPTGEDTMAAKVVEKQVGEDEAPQAQEEEEEEEEEEDGDPKKAKEKNTDDEDEDEDEDEDDDETASPTFTPSNSTSDSPSTSPNGYWVQAETDPAVQAQEENAYWAPAPNNEGANPPASTPNDYWVSPAVEEGADSPVSAPNEYWIQSANEEEVSDAPTNENWGENTGKNNKDKDETEPPAPALTPEISLEGATEAEATAPVATTLSPTMSPTVTTNSAAETPSEETSSEGTPSDEREQTGPYGVRIPPFYLYVEMQGLVNEENFLDVMVSYMQYYMEADFEDFNTITYGVTTYSMITRYSSVSKSTTLDNPVSNVTAHIHLLTAIFNNKPIDQNWEIRDYMEMLLEDDVRMAEYVDMQPNLEYSILSSTLEYEDDAVPPTNVGTNPNGVTEGEEEDKKKGNLMVIIGWTIGAFVVLLWVVFLYGIQSRGEIAAAS